jgi:hypothetical protein
MKWFTRITQYLQLALAVTPAVESALTNESGATKATVALHAIQGLTNIGGAIAPPGQAQDIMKAISIAVGAFNAAGVFQHKDPPVDTVVAPV